MQFRVIALFPLVRAIYQTSSCCMENGVWWVVTCNFLGIIGVNQIVCFKYSALNIFVIFLSLLSHPRTQCHVLLISCLSHFSQLGPSKDSDVLVGPKFALRHKRSRCDGENGSVCSALFFNHHSAYYHPFRSEGICCKLYNYNVGAALEPLWHLCLRPLWRLGHEGSAHS